MGDASGKRTVLGRLGVELLPLVGVWCWLFNRICTSVYEAPANFYNTLGVIALVVTAAPAARLVRRIPAVERLRPLAIGPLCGVLLIFGIWQGRTVVEQVSSKRNEHTLVDIAQNTFEAGKMFVEGGVNPYAFRAQIWHGVEGRDHVTRRHGTVHMYEVPYKYGYPYFPWMFLSYEPFRHIVPNYQAVRLANLLFVLLNAAAVVLLALPRCRPEDRLLTLLALGATLVSAKRAGFELFHFGSTDIVLGVYMLWGVVALDRDRHGLAGLLFGMAQASKLFPSALFVPVTWFWYRDPARRRRFFAAMAAFVVLSVGPFFAWDPKAFISATILFYAVFHADGDRSSYFHILPQERKALFSLARWPLIALVIWLGFRRGRSGIRRLLLVCSVSYLIFLAFNTMLHLNYYWPIFGMTALSLVLLAQPRPPGWQLPLPGIGGGLLARVWWRTVARFRA